MRIGINVPYADSRPPNEMVSFVQAADRLGYDTVWVPEAYGWDAISILAMYACSTERIKLGTGIINVFSRSPALIGQTAAALDAISGGRFVLGLGTSGHQVVAGWHGVPFEKGVKRMQETADVVRCVLKRERVTYEGEVFSIPMGLKLITHPVRDTVPVYFATLTPAGLRATGATADGWLGVFYSAEHFPKVVRPLLEEGARAAGRDIDDLTIGTFQTVVVTDDLAAGRDRVRPYLCLYIGGMGSRERNYYNRLWRQYGFEAEAERIQDLYLAKRRDEALAAVTDEMVDLVSIIGPLDRCRARLSELERSGLDEIALSLTVPDGQPGDLVNALEALAPS
ncbi:MAG TPA: LLM class flavin-dependent oxidoreductase [Candidatus Dormibacteraeota bacterium]